MFAVILSRMVKRIKIPVGLEVKTKNPMVKEGDTAFNQLCAGRCFPHLNQARDSQAAAAIRCGSSGTCNGETVSRVMPASNSLFFKAADS